MEPIQPLSNNNIQLSNVGIKGPNIIPSIDPPVTQRIDIPVSRGLALPIFRMPDPAINYPVINVPTQEEFDAAVRAEKEKEQQTEEKIRKLPDATPLLNCLLLFKLPQFKRQ